MSFFDMHRPTCTETFCDIHQVHDVDELKQHLTKVWRGLGQSIINDAVTAVYGWHKRLVAYVHVKRGHFVHLM